jgi:hypothetical protein
VLTLAALLLFFLSFWKIKKKRDLVLNLGYGTSLIFSLLSLTAYEAWNLVKDAAGYGLLNFISLTSEQQQDLKIVLLCISLGSFVANTIFEVSFERRLDSNFQLRILENFVPSVTSVAILGIIFLTIAFVGEGTSIWFRDLYLQSNGWVLGQKITAVFLLPVLTLIIVSISRPRKPLEATVLHFLLMCGFFFYLAKGSRGSFIVVILYALMVLTTKASALSKILKILLCLSITVLSLTVIVNSRKRPHGLVEILNNANFDLVSASSFGNIKLLIAFAISWVIVLPLSVETGLPQALISNLNPLIGTGLDPFASGSFGSERLFPYRWVPTSAAGQLYGAFGPLLIVAITLILTLITLRACSSAERLQRLDQLLVGLLLFLYSFQFLIFLQYSSRNWYRIMWIMFAIFLIYSLRTVSVAKVRNGERR